MERVAVTPEVAVFIRERVQRFEQEAPEGVRRLNASAVREHEALPLFFGWTQTLAIRPDGVLVRWTVEGWPGAQEFDERTWVNVALVQGAARYPELASLIPTRPPEAETCPRCRGEGVIPAAPKDVICTCGGTGWLRPIGRKDKPEAAGRPTTR
jgi:hypothetical protein